MTRAVAGAVALAAALIPWQSTDLGPRFSDRTGPYLGEKPPGLTPAVFAPGLVSTGGFERDVAITPDGREIFFGLAGPSYQYTTVVVHAPGRRTLDGARGGRRPRRPPIPSPRAGAVCGRQYAVRPVHAARPGRGRHGGQPGHLVPRPYARWLERSPQPRAAGELRAARVLPVADPRRHHLLHAGRGGQPRQRHLAGATGGKRVSARRRSCPRRSTRADHSSTRSWRRTRAT